MAYNWLNYDIDPGVYVRHPLYRDYTATSWGVRVQVSFDPPGGPQINLKLGAGCFWRENKNKIRLNFKTLGMLRGSLAILGSGVVGVGLS